jgi:SAM-dependent methyltransferase
VLNILRRFPDQILENYTSSHAGRGLDYDENFDRLPFRRLLWELEQTALAQLLMPTAARVVVDLACGTGRIAEVVTRVLPDADVLGVDVAETMLARARTRVPTARFVGADVRRLDEIVPPGSVDLVTAFRFFANADGPLRTEAMKAIAAIVRPGGFLLLNNHRNFWSPSYVVRRARSGTAPGARNRDLLSPLHRLGFQVIGRRSLGITLHADSHAYLLPLSVAATLERTNLRLLSGSHSLGTDTLWLLQRHGGATSWAAAEARSE